MSASANNNKVTKATLNFAKQTQLVKVDTQKAKKKIDKDKIIRELNQLIEELRKEMKEKDDKIRDLKKEVAAGGGIGGVKSVSFAETVESVDSKDDDFVDLGADDDIQTEKPAHAHKKSVFDKIDELNQEMEEAQAEEDKWMLQVDAVGDYNNMTEDEMRKTFNEFDEDGGGTIDGEELQNALKTMGQDMTMDEVINLIHEIDENGDGEVDFDEFKVMVNQSWFINAYQSKLAASVEKALTVRMNLGDFGDILSDDDDYEDDGDENKLDDSEEEPTPKVSELQEKDKEIEKLQNELKELMTQQTAEKQQYEQQLEELSKTKVATEKSGNDNSEYVQQQLTELKQQNEKLQNENKELKQSNDNKDELEEEIEKLKRNVMGLSNENDELKDNLDSLRNENEELRRNNDKNDDNDNTLSPNSNDDEPEFVIGTPKGFKNQRSSQRPLAPNDGNSMSFVGRQLSADDKRILSTPQLILVATAMMLAIALAVEGIICFAICDPDVRAYILSTYYLVFAVIVMVSELYVHKDGILFDYLSFLKYRKGRAAWYIFIGTISFGDKSWDIVIAILWILLGIANILAIRFNIDDDQDTKNQMQKVHTLSRRGDGYDFEEQAINRVQSDTPMASGDNGGGDTGGDVESPLR